MLQIMKVHPMGGQAYDSNIYLLQTEIPAIIDTGTEWFIKDTIRRIEEIMPLDEIEKIILTHRHYDHTGGAKKLKELTGAEIFIHEKDSAPLLMGDDVSTGAKSFNAEQPRLEVSILKGDETIDLGDVELKVIYTPGHSIGSIALYHKPSKSLFSGDTIFCDGGIGRWDLISGDYRQLVDSIKMLSKLEVINLYPGHGNYSEGRGQTHVNLALDSILSFSRRELMARRL